MVLSLLLCAGCSEDYLKTDPPPDNTQEAAHAGLKAATAVTIRARGTAGSETIQLKVGNTTVATWTLTTTLQNYTVSTSETGSVVVQFTNDDGTNRDVQIDYAQYNGTTYQAEGQAINTGVWQNSSCGGSNSEWLHCSGYIQFPDLTGDGTGTGITVRARGTAGSETIQLKVGSTTVASWTLTTSLQNYTASTSATGAVVVQFTNDASGRDVQVDYLQYGGSTYQAENQPINTGVWNGSSCGGSNSEWLHCNGYIQFPNIGGGGVIPSPTWRADARSFLDGPSGSFDDIAVKDPTIVYSGGRYHLFYTGRDNSLWRMGYASATSVSGLNSASRSFMSALNGGSYFCAPQVFWFGVKGKWFLVYQSGLGATFSTNTDIGNPGGWTAGRAMGFTDGIDFWCISEGSNVYCFYSAQDGSRTIKRRSTTVANFPYSWSTPSVVATNTFEAPHVYRNNSDGKYYMVVEDIARHQELWSATSPGGTWTQISEKWASKDKLLYNSEHWTDQVSHGELIRSGTNELMEINNINQVDYFIQGVADGNYGDYGNIPYDLGIIRNY